MSSTINSIRWTRRGNSQIRNKSTSLIESPNESFKLPALNALNKSIKYGDLSFATNQDLNKLRKQPEQVDNIQELSAHHSLIVIRKKYDNMNKTREAIQREVDDMEQKRDKFLGQKNRFEQEKAKGSSKVEAFQQNLNEIKHQLEESEVEKKIMLSMVERLKHDKVVYDLRKYKLEKEFTYIQKQKQIILKQNAGKMEEDDKTKKIHQKLMEHLEEEKRERESHINNMETMISEKVALNENSELRKSEMKEIAENTLQDKDQKEKNWYKVYLSCRFVEKLLRDKMTREMIKFNTVEVAYKNIKTSTGVSNTGQLVKKFLNKESAYGELLGKIAENERNIAELKSQNEELAKQRRKLETQQDVLNSNRSELKNLEKEEKQLHLMSEKSKNCLLLFEKLRDWGVKNLKKINSIENRSEEVEVKSDSKDMVNLLKTYFQRVSQSLDEIKEVNVNQAHPNVNLGGNNLRIVMNPQEERIPTKPHNENDQQDFMNTQRNQIIKNNDKFMKDVKRKYEDIRKAKFQAQPKRKETVIEKPKPQPVGS